MGVAVSGMIRFGSSIEKGLLQRFARMIRGEKYTSRSEALRDLIRTEHVEIERDADRDAAGAITYIYDHHRRELMNRLTDLQHDYQQIIISTQHIHLDHDHCLEIVAVRGRLKGIRQLADALKAVKGVRHGSLSITSLGREMV